MRYLRIFSLQFQEVIQDRSRIVVWFLLACVSPLILILFWRGATHIPGWTTAEIMSYYLFAIVIYAGAMCHQEDHVATVDIQEGGLTAYLLKPFSYLKLIFFNEVSYRMVQGTIGLILLGVLMLAFPQLFAFTKSPAVLLLSILILFGAFALTFFFKMCVGLLGFWMTETRGAFEAVNVLITIFAGILVPLAFLPVWLEQIAYYLPFSYMLYFPIIAFEGKLSIIDLWHVFALQLFWIAVCYFLYRMLWRAGLKKYTAVGQ
jgi:ABC-2 type transport system permease protein